ncbi:hypothetical protein ABZU86_13705 [Streptomyces sp. NPDC005271]|uniref:hypothetical protein n=1 Tax=unclassified Streptomyces TaxID=2593676 RepID=UPI0033BB0B32
MDDAPQETPPARPDTAALGASGETPSEVLSLAAPRRRTVDDHMFRAGRTSFRLQLFTAPGQRAVAVAIQAEGETPSLTNVAESCAAAVWQQHCPDQGLPPVWIERQFPGAFGREPDFRLVTFGENEPYQVRHPSWCTISAEQIVHLVGGPVAEDRGKGYVPPEPEPEPDLRFEAMALWRLARPRPFREECMSGGTPWWRRWTNRVFPQHGGRSCCWYHSGDWHRVNHMALAALSRAQHEGVKAECMGDYALEYAAAAGASEWEQQVFRTLYCLGDAIQPSGDGYISNGFINGQHRVQAMLDAGVRRTVVLRHVWPDSPAY